MTCFCKIGFCSRQEEEKVIILHLFHHEWNERLVKGSLNELMSEKWFCCGRKGKGSFDYNIHTSKVHLIKIFFSFCHLFPEYGDSSSPSNCTTFLSSIFLSTSSSLYLPLISLTLRLFLSSLHPRSLHQINYWFPLFKETIKVNSKEKEGRR